MNVVSAVMQPRSAKRYRLKIHPAPLRIRDSVQIFALAEVLGGAEAALVVWTLRGWLAHNQSTKKNYREGHIWTYYSLPKWCEKHFKWLTPKQLGTIMTSLVKQGVIIRKQFRDRDGFKTCYWYRIDEEALAALTSAKPVAGKTPAQTVTPSADSGSPCAQMVAPSAQMVAQTTEESSNKNLQNKNIKRKQQQQLTAETDVVVVDPFPHREPEAESGEHSIDGEGHDTTAVKAFVPHEQHHDEQPFPKVPEKGFPAVPALVADLIRFGVAPYRSQQLAEQYPETDIRYVMGRACAATNLDNPPGFVVRELEKGAAGVLGLRDSKLVQKFMHDSPAPIDDERLAAIRRENERMAAEDAAAAEQAPPDDMLPAVPDASDPDALYSLRMDGALV